jgi:hypothetical protein
MTRTLLLACASLPLLAMSALAQQTPSTACTAHVAGAPLVLGSAATGDDPAAVNGSPDTSDLPACDPAAVLRHFTPDLVDGDRAAFCLVRAETEDGTPTFAGFSEGPRDDDLLCTTPTGRLCERVNAARDAALDIAGLGDTADARDTAGAAAEGIRSLRDRAGATILTGTGGAGATTLSNLGASALAAVTAPAAVAAGVVSVVAIGGAVYVCR